MEDFKAARASADDALKRGDPAGALEALQRAAALEPTEVSTRLQIALCLRMMGRYPAALAALDETLALEPYLLVALLSKGFVLEKMGLPRSAAQVYRNAIKIAPDADKLPDQLRAPLERAKTAIAEDIAAMREAIAANVSSLTKNGGYLADRFEQATGVFLGERKIYERDPILLNYPELPTIQFYDRELFPWLPKLEAATETIKGELEAVLAEDWGRFAPYIQYPKDAPKNQWAKLDHNSDWSTLYFWKDSVRDDETCRRCPKTAALLEELPLLDQPGFGPTAVFSVLQPHTHIPPHTGSVNTRLLCHLPLILPANCRFRVGNDTRDWEMGKAWVFDDTIEHEAWNDSGEVRVIMIFDLWNPFLSEREKEFVTAMLSAQNAYLKAEGGEGFSLGD